MEKQKETSSHINQTILLQKHKNEEFLVQDSEEEYIE